MKPVAKRDDMRLLIVFLTFLVILTACAVPTQPASAPTDIVETHSADAVLGGTFETSLLISQWKGSKEGNMLFPLSPTSGTALPGYTPISLGQSSFHAFSPDRRTLAVVSFADSNIYNGTLLLVDLTEWSTRRFELELSGWVSAMVFSPDGKGLAIAHGETNYKLTTVDMEKGTITAQTRTDFIVTHLKYTERGDALMLYSPTIDPVVGWTAGPPRVLLLDATDLELRWLVELKDVHDGVFPGMKALPRPMSMNQDRPFTSIRDWLLHLLVTGFMSSMQNPKS